MHGPIDPRVSVIERRLAGVRRMIAVAGGKGGIGKTSIASMLALAFADTGRATGLLDLDLTSPTDHIVLGAPTGFPTEEFGIDPSVHEGIRFFSVAHFLGDTPSPLRGEDVTSALLEILAVVAWKDLDVLVIDMPPGLGDTVLDLKRFMPSSELLIVSTSSRVVLETVERHLAFLTAQKARILGVLENMARVESPRVRELADRFELPFLGTLAYDAALEEALGNPALLRATGLYRALSGIARDVLR